MFSVIFSRASCGAAAALSAVLALSGCMDTLTPQPVSLSDHDPFKRYPLGAEYDCAAEMPADERLNPTSAPTRGFGCSHQSNITAMIANPDRLTTPAVMGPADPERRRVVLESYRSGQATSAQISAQGPDALINNVQ